MHAPAVTFLPLGARGGQTNGDSYVIQSQRLWQML